MPKKASITLIFDFPLEMMDFSILQVGKQTDYFNLSIAEKKFKLHYKEGAGKVLADMAILCGQKSINISAWFSEFFLHLLEKTDPKLYSTIKSLAQTGSLEILGGTPYGSLASLYSKSQFNREVALQKQSIKNHFNFEPKNFYNTENIYFNGLVKILAKHGYSSLFTSSIEWYLGRNYNERVFQAVDNRKFKISLIDEHQNEAFVQNRDQKQYIFQFDTQLIEKNGGLNKIVTKISAKADLLNLTELISKSAAPAVYNIKNPIIGSIHHLSIPSFNGNAMQLHTLRRYYDMENRIFEQPDEELRESWTKLGAARYFQKMSTFHEHNDRRPFDSYNQYMNILTDMELRIS